MKAPDTPPGFHAARREDRDGSAIEVRRRHLAISASTGVRLLVYCTSGLYCYHSAVIADRWPDDPVILDLDRKLVSTKYSIIGGQVRRKWDDGVLGDSLTGTQWG